MTEKPLAVAELDDRKPVGNRFSVMTELPSIFNKLGIKLPSEEILKKIDRLYGDVWSFLATDVREMTFRFGFSQVDAVALSLFSTLGDYLNTTAPEDETEDVMTAAKKYFSRVLRGKRYEELWIRCYDRRNKLILSERIAKGSVDEIIVTPRAVVEKAVSVNSCRVIIAHNHPNSDALPSISDQAFTTLCHEMLKRWKVSLLDHIIIGGDDLYSFVDSGKLERVDPAMLTTPAKRKGLKKETL